MVGTSVICLYCLWMCGAYSFLVISSADSSEALPSIGGSLYWTRGLRKAWRIHSLTG